jgi:3-oxoacyl-[acyl-carrier protein] reductase
MDMSGMLENQYALVTGATRGIGREVAETFARNGCNVGVTSRDPRECEAVAAELERKFGVRAIGTPCDVSIRDSVAGLFGRLRRWSSDRLDVLVCNAGFPFLDELWNTPIHKTPAEQLEQWYTGVFRVDTLGSVLCTYEALPMMMEQKSGSILYVSSTPALQGFQGAPYTIAKAGILGLMRDVAHEYGKWNIRANALALGNIDTPATFDVLDHDTQRKFAEDAPLKRWGTPREVADAALFLASRMSGFMTGQTLVVDGGTVRF